jgi:hypothetical protein
MEPKALRVAAILILVVGLIAAILLPTIQCHGELDPTGPCPDPGLKYWVAIASFVISGVVYRRSLGRSN